MFHGVVSHYHHQRLKIFVDQEILLSDFERDTTESLGYRKQYLASMIRYGNMMKYATKRVEINTQSMTLGDSAGSVVTLCNLHLSGIIFEAPRDSLVARSFDFQTSIAYSRKAITFSINSVVP